MYNIHPIITICGGSYGPTPETNIRYVFVFCVCVKLTKSTHLMFRPVHGTLLPDISHCCSCRRLVTSLGIVLITNFTHTSKNCSIQIHDSTVHTPLTGWTRYQHFISVECSSPDYHIDSSNFSACCRCFCLILSIYLSPDMVIRAQSSLSPSPWPLYLKQTSSN